MKRFAIIIALCILVVSPAAVAVERMQMPTWPQNFALASGEHVVFGIPNPGTGTIKVKLNWNGSPLLIGATGSDKSVVLAPASKAAPAQEFTIDAAAAKCPVFLVNLELPRDAAAVSGTINVESAPVGQNQARQLATMSNQAPSTNRALLRMEEDPWYRSIKTALANRISQQELQKNTMSKTLQSNAQADGMQMKSMLSAMARPGGNTRISGFKIGGLLGGKFKGNIARPSVQPAISSVNPAQGMSGAAVTLTGVGLNENATEVWFTIAQGVDVQANVLSATKASNGTITIVAQVPEKQGVTQAFNGQVYAKAADWNPPYATNKLAFQFQPIVAPAIVYIDPVEVGPGTVVNLDGNGFTAGDTIHFAIPGVQDFAAQTTLVSGTRLSGQVPPYVSRQIGYGSVYISRPTPASTVNSQGQSMIFKPTIPFISNMPTSEVSENPFTITGMSFGTTGEVHAIDAGGVDAALTVDSWTDTHIIVRAPSAVGFTGTKPYQIYVKNGSGKSDNKPFAITPMTDHVLMQMAELVNSKDYFVSTAGSGYCGLSSPSGNSNVLWMYGRHEAGMFDGHKGDDWFFKNRTLQNGWTVEKIDYKPSNSTALGGAGSRMERDYSSYYGSTSPYVPVHWWCDAMWGSAVYQFAITIQGPKGVAY